MLPPPVTQVTHCHAGPANTLLTHGLQFEGEDIFHLNTSTGLTASKGAYMSQFITIALQCQASLI